MRAATKIGIAGWSYQDWKGVVYPRSCKDTLRYCAELVDVIEINSSFYHLPVAAHCESWVRRVEDLPLAFTAKLPGEFTHRGSQDDGLARQAREGFAPLREDGRLRSLLAQFAHWFEHSPENVAHLRWLRDAFEDVAVLTAEVRHRSWATAAGLADLADLGIGVATLDYPGAVGGFAGPGRPMSGVTGLAYFRIHGRNRDAWFDPESGRDETYDYEYSDAEVDELAAQSDRLASDQAETLVIANNHFEGKALKLALELLARVRGQRVLVPDPMVRAYPGLGAIARQVQGGLFD